MAIMDKEHEEREEFYLQRDLLKCVQAIEETYEKELTKPDLTTPKSIL